MERMFANNINYYLKRRGINYNYIALMTGWNIDKIRCLLNGNADLNWNDMMNLSGVLGHEVGFFTKDEAEFHENEDKDEQDIYLSSNIWNEDRILVDKIVEMFRFYDSLISVQL